MRRAVVWLAIHALPVLAALVAIEGYLWELRIARVLAPYVAGGIVPADRPYAGYLVWTAQRYAGWALAVLILPCAVAQLFAWGTPRLQLAARYAISKWSLYAGIMPLITGLLFAIVVQLPKFDVPVFLVFGLSVNEWTTYEQEVATSYPANIVLVLTGIYGIWWAIGVASQPWLPRRGFHVFLLSFMLYAAALRLALEVLQLEEFKCLL